MKRFSVYCVAFVALLSLLTKGAVVVNKSENLKDFGLRSVKTQATERSPERPQTETVFKAKKLTRKEKCCNLGRDVAKIGETCTYTTNVGDISPNKHFHQMKTAVWTRRSHPINRRLLAKCKPHKVFYEKCCNYEYSLIEQDLIKERKKIKQYLRQVRKNEVEEDQGSSSDEGGLPVEKGISHSRHRHKI